VVEVAGEPSELVRPLDVGAHREVSVGDLRRNAGEALERDDQLPAEHEAERQRHQRGDGADDQRSHLGHDRRVRLLVGRSMAGQPVSTPFHGAGLVTTAEPGAHGCS
jgi:hypothetical protein